MSKDRSQSRFIPSILLSLNLRLVPKVSATIAATILLNGLLPTGLVNASEQGALGRTSTATAKITLRIWPSDQQKQTSSQSLALAPHVPPSAVSQLCVNATLPPTSQTNLYTLSVADGSLDLGENKLAKSIETLCNQASPSAQRGTSGHESGTVTMVLAPK